MFPSPMEYLKSYAIAMAAGVVAVVAINAYIQLAIRIPRRPWDSPV